MILLTPDLRARLLVNGRQRGADHATHFISFRASGQITPAGSR